VSSVIRLRGRGRSLPRLIANTGNEVEPVLFHIVNTHDFDEKNGLHAHPGDEWRCEEQLMDRDVIGRGLPPARIRWYLSQVQRLRGMPHWHRNGDMPMFGPITGFL
jgi:hypothetical protein